MKTAITRTLITGALLFATSAVAADPQPSPQPAPDKLSAVREQIAAKNFPGAIDELKRLNDTGDADWNNLMGYSLRKGATPDFAGAEQRLTALDKACFLPCEEYSDLKKAIAQYKANGGKASSSY